MTSAIADNISESLSDTKPTPERVLKDVFGYGAFRDGQDEVIHHVCDGGDALVLLPTGGGKSLCYQIPALVREGTAVVVSPLISLMQDQVEQLKALGVKAAYLNSTLEPEAQARINDDLQSGKLDLLYVSPERLMQYYFQQALSHANICLFAIDEAHCVSQWGHDFRQDYLLLHQLADWFPGVPRMALTATADMAPKAMALPVLGLVAGLLVAVFISYRRPRDYVTPSTTAAAARPASPARLKPLQLVITLGALAVALVFQLKFDSLLLGAMVGFLILGVSGIFR